MTDICNDCSRCERRETCADVTLLLCPACGTRGTIQNIFDANGEFETIRFSEDIEVMEVEGHSVPLCKKCRAMMEPEI